MKKLFNLQLPETTDRYYHFSTSDIEKARGHNYSEFSIIGNQLIRADYQHGKTFTDHTTLFPPSSGNQLQFLYNEIGRIRISYDTKNNEYYFSKTSPTYLRTQTVFKILKETYPPEECLDTGFLNAKNSSTGAKRGLLAAGYTEIQLDEFLNEIITKATKLTKGCTSSYDKITLISEWIKKHIHHPKSVTGYSGYPHETLASPYLVWKTKTAVCYGYAQLTELMLQAVGVPCLTIRDNLTLIGSSSHVVNAVYVDDQWVLIDTTNLNKFPVVSFLGNPAFICMSHYFSFMPNLVDGGVCYTGQTIPISHTLNMVLVTFEANGGKVKQPKRYFPEKDTYIRLESPTKKGHIFENWYLSDTFSGTPITPASVVSKHTPHTLYAKWRSL